MANCRYGNDGNQGGFYDPAYRLAYGGQDGGAGLIASCGRAPIATKLAASYDTVTIADFARVSRPVYRIHLAAPLSVQQIRSIASRPPNLRLESSSGYFGYLIPPGLSVPPVSDDGATLLVDSWVCATCHPQVPASEGALPPRGDTVSIDMLHQMDGLYVNPNFKSGDQLSTLIGIEFSFTNTHNSLPPLDLGEPLPSDGSDLMLGLLGGVAGPYGGRAFAVATTGWQAAFVARNAGSTGTHGDTVGVLCPIAGPKYCAYSTLGAGHYLLASDPGNTGTPTMLIDSAGNYACVHCRMDVLDVAARNTLRVPFGTPTSARAPCHPGQIEVDTSYLYTCVAPDTWHRVSNGTAW